MLLVAQHIFKMNAQRNAIALLLLLAYSGTFCNALLGSAVSIENWSGVELRIVWGIGDKPISQWPVYTLEQSWQVRASGWNNNAPNDKDVLMFITRYSPNSPNVTSVWNCVDDMQTSSSCTHTQT